MKEFTVKQFDVDETEITILSYDEAMEVPIEIRRNSERWWLRSADSCYSSFVGCVYTLGYVNWVSYDNTYGVRPAFRINNLKSNVGDKVLVGKTWCTCIFEDAVLVDKCICDHRFDGSSNDWGTSELKAFIESDEFKGMI